MIRAFIAIELPPHVIESIGRLQERLKSSDFRISWVRPENIHLTLKFLGDIDSDRVQEIGKLMTRALSRQEPLEIFASGLGVFPGVRSPRVIWVGIDGQVQGIAAIQASIDQYLAGAGFAKEKRAFTGHLTLGRVKGPIAGRLLEAAMRSLEDFKTQGFRVDHVSLFKSQLTPQGAIYSRLISVPLENRPPEQSGSPVE